MYGRSSVGSRNLELDFGTGVLERWAVFDRGHPHYLLVFTLPCWTVRLPPCRDVCICLRRFFFRFISLGHAIQSVDTKQQVLPKPVWPSKAVQLLGLVGLLLTPTTPLAQSLPGCHDIASKTHERIRSSRALCTGCACAIDSGSARACPWWWCRLKRKRVSDDSEGELIHERLLRKSGRAGIWLRDDRVWMRSYTSGVGSG